MDGFKKVDCLPPSQGLGFFCFFQMRNGEISKKTTKTNKDKQTTRKNANEAYAQSGGVGRSELFTRSS